MKKNRVLHFKFDFSRGSHNIWYFFSDRIKIASMFMWQWCCMVIALKKSYNLFFSFLTNKLLCSLFSFFPFFISFYNIVWLQDEKKKSDNGIYYILCYINYMKNSFKYRIIIIINNYISIVNLIAICTTKATNYSVKEV